MKTYTDLSQSKKLAEILPLESADMSYSIIHNVGQEPYHCNVPMFVPAMNGDIPCWSLSALLDVLPNGNMLVKTTDGKYYCIVKDIMTKHYDNPLDVCYKTILELKEKD